jgi:hypothetical protein
MLKTVLTTVIKRYWGLVAVIVMITAFSQYRHEHQLSLGMLLISLLPALLGILIVVVPLELHKLRKHR